MNLDATTILGVLAGLITAASNIPQVIKTWREGATEDLSLKMLLLLAAGLSLWSLYGFLKPDPFVMLSNLFSACLTFYLVLAKLRSGNTAG